MTQPAPQLRYKTFSQYYSEATIDYRRILARFNPDNQVAVPGAVLLDQVVGSGISPQGYLAVSST